MAEMVRVVLLPKNAEGSSAGDRQIILDLAVDAERTAVGPFPAFGRFGDYTKDATLFPFTLMGDGRIDYGAFAEDRARQDKLAIRSTKLLPGAAISHVAPDRTETFVIATVTPLVSA